VQDSWLSVFSETVIPYAKLAVERQANIQPNTGFWKGMIYISPQNTFLDMKSMSPTLQGSRNWVRKKSGCEIFYLVSSRCCETKTTYWSPRFSL